MSKASWKDGLWTRNIVLAQLLALCPLLAVTTTAVNGLGMGIATMVVLMISNVVISVLRSTIHRDVRIPAFVVIIATVVTIVDLSMNAYLHDLHKVLGLFIPLIVTNCAVLGRAESFAYKNNPKESLIDGAAMGLGFTWALMLIGAVREIIGSGTLFSGAALLGGDWLEGAEMTLLHGTDGFVLALLPPGGFFAVGFIIALKQRLERPRDVVEELPVISPAE